ncbi:helix-turn-helix domain-containing protein [Actinopolyspora sp. H202]|uniref:Helix-turn-helix n=2 Tax=Actinopolyspora mzabensis TaxID=995066 RepID=A0A1G9CAC2_ACTMZ|nr:Helix-turn-helix [Actinopolyspora mzabensis]
MDLGKLTNKLADEKNAMSANKAGRENTFAGKLAHLIATVHPPDRGTYSYREIEAGIRHLPGAMSAQYISQLKTGTRTNPKIHYVEALAEFFGVPAGYFFDDEVTERIDAQIADLKTWRDTEARDIAQRFAGLDRRDRNTVSNLIDSLDAYNARPRHQRARRKTDRDHTA